MEKVNIDVQVVASERIAKEVEKDLKWAKAKAKNKEKSILDSENIIGEVEIENSEDQGPD